MTARSLSRPLNGTLLWLSFALLALGNVLVIYAVATNQANVLYTSYAPLQGHWTYYVGLVFVVVSTWMAATHLAILPFTDLSASGSMSLARSNPRRVCAQHCARAMPTQAAYWA